MQYTKTYDSPLGEILLAADEQGLTGLWFDKEKYFARNLDPGTNEEIPGAKKETCRWLDVYFSGRSQHLLHLCISSARLSKRSLADPSPNSLWRNRNLR